MMTAFFSFPPKFEKPVSVLHQCLMLMDWIMSNKSELNPDKTEILLINQNTDEQIWIQTVLGYTPLAKADS